MYIILLYIYLSVNVISQRREKHPGSLAYHTPKHIFNLIYMHTCPNRQIHTAGVHPPIPSPNARLSANRSPAFTPASRVTSMPVMASTQSVRIIRSSGLSAGMPVYRCNEGVLFAHCTACGRGFRPRLGAETAHRTPQTSLDSAFQTMMGTDPDSTLEEETAVRTSIVCI
jgi:hypothetical protein